MINCFEELKNYVKYIFFYTTDYVIPIISIHQSLRAGHARELKPGLPMLM
jgi:hypothetical protein